MSPPYPIIIVTGANGYVSHLNLSFDFHPKLYPAALDMAFAKGFCSTFAEEIHKTHYRSL
jgi:hypothetical protein